MINARKQIKTLLESLETSISYTVKTQFPQSVSEGNLITYFELWNTQTAISVIDDIAFQIDIWGETYETMLELAKKSSDKLCSIGLKRQFTSPDTFPKNHGEYYRKTMRFGRKVDTRTNRLID